VLFRRLLFFCIFSALLLHASEVTVLVLPFHNESQSADLNWIGESVSETLMTELGAAGQIVLDRGSRKEGYRRLALQPDTFYTKATLLKLGQTLDARLVCYGAYQITLPSPDAQPRDGSIRISARFLDLRKLRDASEFSETGKLSDLSRLEEHLAWQAIRFLDPQSTITAEELMQPSKLIRLDAKESFIRGLLATNNDQKQKWFEQAVKLDPQYWQPAFELGKLAFAKKDYRQAETWFGRIPQTDPLYLDASFQRGLSSYWAGDYPTAERCFRDLAKTVPLNEVFNNLGAAESKLNTSEAADNFRHALEGDQSDTTYNFNLAISLYRQSKYDEAAQHLRAVLDHDPHDNEAIALLAKCQAHTPPAAAAGHGMTERIKSNFDLVAFRQLKDVLQRVK
jgi:tetratricopeptide (TPR) repeat protein